jgi:hypothetical protein
MGAAVVSGVLPTMQNCENKPIKAMKIKEFLFQCDTTNPRDAGRNLRIPSTRPVGTRLAVDYINEPTAITHLATKNAKTNPPGISARRCEDAKTNPLRVGDYVDVDTEGG